ncbi:MAG: 2-hydroxychromene-2-carboxylate isomerase [Stellaceae bacterium]
MSDMIPRDRPIRFYFDFLSPYAYLGSVAIERFAARLGYRVEWRPVLLGITVLKIMGMKPLMEVPLKGPYLARDFVRQAEYLGIPALPFAQAQSIAPLPPMRAFVMLDEDDPVLAKRFGQEVFHARWVRGENPSTPEGLTAIGRRLDIDPAGLIAANQDQTTKERLRTRVDEAIGQGVFGVPTFEVGGELFWGADHLPQLERWLATGGW